MLNDFDELYDINMIQEVINLIEELDKKNEKRKNLYSEYKINIDNLRTLYENTDKQLADEAYELLDSAMAKGRVIVEHSKFNVKDLGDVIAKYLTDIDNENRKFYYKQIKVNYGSKEEDAKVYNVIAYADIDENRTYSFQELKELTCFEYRSSIWDYDTENTGIYTGLGELIQCRIPEDERVREIRVKIDKHYDFTLENKTNAIDLRGKIIEFVDTLINYRIYHKLENITKEDLEKFELEYVLIYNKKEDKRRKLTK